MGINPIGFIHTLAVIQSDPAIITRSGHQPEIKMYENHFYKADWKELDRLVEAA